VISMSVAGVKNHEVKEGIDANYLKGCQLMLFNQWVKAFKYFRQCDENTKFYTKVKNLYLQKLFEDGHPDRLREPEIQYLIKEMEKELNKRYMTKEDLDLLSSTSSLHSSFISNISPTTKGTRKSISKTNKARFTNMERDQTFGKLSIIAIEHATPERVSSKEDASKSMKNKSAVENKRETL